MLAEEVCKNRRSNNKFHCNKKNTLINIARITKSAKVSTYNEKGKEGPKREVGKFCKNKKKLTRIFIAITTTTNTIKYRKNKKNAN